MSVKYMEMGHCYEIVVKYLFITFEKWGSSN